MDVSLEKSSLLSIVQNTQRALSGKSSLPVLNGILLEAKDNTLTAYSTDLEISIKDKTDASVATEGRLVVFGNILGDLVKSINDGKISLVIDKKNNKLIVKSSGSRFDLNTLPVEDFPSFPETGEDTTYININKKEFEEAAKQVVVAASRDDGRPVLTGVLIETTSKKSRMVATDSYRLSLKIIKTSQKEHAPIIVPRRAIEEIIKIMSGGENLKISFSDKQISFVSGNLVFVSRLIGGQYPNFEQLFPKEFQTEIIANKEEVMQSAKRMSLLSSTTPIILRAKDNKLTMSNKSADVGSGEEEIKTKNKIKDIEVAFNSKYLIDGLGAIRGEEAKIQLIDSFQPGIIKGSEEEYEYLIMPVRMN